MESLPEDLILYICIHVRSLRDLQALACTCRSVASTVKQAFVPHLLSKYAGNVKYAFLESCSLGLHGPCVQLLRLCVQGPAAAASVMRVRDELWTCPWVAEQGNVFAHRGDAEAEAELMR